MRVKSLGQVKGHSNIHDEIRSFGPEEFGNKHSHLNLVRVKHKEV